MARRLLLVFMALAPALVGASSKSQTEQTQAPIAPEAAGLAQGWAQLNRGDTTAASATGNSLLAQFPSSASILAFAIEAEVARGGALSALNTYERWLGSRRVDDAYVLRRLARALLREHSLARQSPVRVEALKDLAADGDLDAMSELDNLASRGGGAETAALASIGNEKAVHILIGELKNQPGDRTGLIKALLDSRSRLAIPPLMDLLTDPNDVTQAAAADALGKLGAVQAIEQIKPLLKGRPPAPLKAAEALYRLHDMSGLASIRALEVDPEPAVRLLAAQALASNPDAAWQALVRSLLLAPQPHVRWEAAKLIAPYDPESARIALEGLMTDDNAGVREAAGQTYIQDVAGDFAVLRRFLRSTDPLTGVRAADRILDLTR